MLAAAQTGGELLQFVSVLRAAGHNLDAGKAVAQAFQHFVDRARPISLLPIAVQCNRILRLRLSGGTASIHAGILTLLSRHAIERPYSFNPIHHRLSLHPITLPV